MARGIFEELYSYRPRVGSTPAENFLTQAFAHVLRHDREACEAFLALAYGEAIRLPGSYSVDTQLSRGEEEDAGIPDMQIRATLNDDRQLHLICEHKWDAPVSAEQLARYVRTLPPDQTLARVVLVANTRELPTGTPTAQGTFGALTWSDVHGALSPVSVAAGSLLPDLLQFLESQGMGPELAISTARIAALTFAAPVLAACEAVATRLMGMDWSTIPKAFRVERPVVKDHWGRLGIEFNTKWDKDWRAPGLFLGFLVDPVDHEVTLTEPVRGFDLMLTIDRDPSVEPDERAIGRALRRVRQEFPVATVQGPAELENRHRLLMIRVPAAKALGSAADVDSQAGALHTQLSQWAAVLFAGREVEEALAVKYPRWRTAK
jgi:hypothetical protein